MLNAKSKGQTLFELTIAIAVAVLILAGVVHVITVSIRNASFAKNKSEATRYAQEANEWLRAERDASWATFSGKATSGETCFCLSSLSWPGSITCPSSGANSCATSGQIGTTIFSRQIKLIPSSSTTIDVATEVFWNDSAGQHETLIETKLTDWSNQ